MIIKKLRSVRSTLLFLGITLLIGLIISLGVGAVPLTPAEVLQALFRNSSKTVYETIIWDFRLARVLLVCLCGAALSASGVAFQGLFRNPLADPFVVGASGGAALGATLSAVFGASIPMGIAGFLGALAAVLLVYSIAESSNYGSIAALLMAGAALSTMLSAIVTLLLILREEVLYEVFAWLMGGFAGRSWSHLRQALLVAPLGIVIIWLMVRPLDALAAGEESAEALGLNLRQTRFMIIVGASLATAAAVAVSGIIGFVGLIAPHIARTLVGAKHAKTLPISMLLGALLLLLADGFARTIMAPVELPVGVFTALLGGPFFLFLLRKGRNII